MKNNTQRCDRCQQRKDDVKRKEWHGDTRMCSDCAKVADVLEKRWAKERR